MTPVLERFLSKISVSETTFHEGTPCWEWNKHRRSGYGAFYFQRKRVASHRFMYEYYYGSIQEGLVIHHKCYNHACCNILHLEERTIRDNILDKDSSAPAAIHSRKTHCPQGHKFTPENTYTYPNKGRYCKKCQAMCGSQRRLKNKVNSAH